MEFPCIQDIYWTMLKPLKIFRILCAGELWDYVVWFMVVLSSTGVLDLPCFAYKGSIVIDITIFKYILLIGMNGEACFLLRKRMSY